MNGSSPTSGGPLVVGVVPGQSPAVLRHAIELAQELHAEVLCAHVDPARYPIMEAPDGTVATLPLDPDLPELEEEEFPPQLAEQVRAQLADTGADWSLRALAGDPAWALARLAERAGARMIIVGSREAGVRAGIQSFFTGSVAVRLAHRQHRPVLVVPVAPKNDEERMPWE